MKARRLIWLRLRDQVASLVGEEISESLLGEFEERAEQPGHRRRHLLVAYPGDNLMRTEFVEMGDQDQMYNAWQTRITKPEVSRALVSVIDQALAQAEESPLRE